MTRFYDRSRTRMPSEKLDAAAVRKYLLLFASAAGVAVALTLAARGLNAFYQDAATGLSAVWAALSAATGVVALSCLRMLRSRTGAAWHIPLGNFTASISFFLTAGLYLLAWSWPGALWDGCAKALISMLALELVLIIAAPFLAVFLSGSKGWEGWAIAALLASFCAVYALLFAAQYGNSGPIAAVAFLFLGEAAPFVFGRGTGGDIGIADAEGARFCAALAAGLAALFACFVVPLPELGSGLPLAVRDSVFLKQPWKPLAAGAFYFTARGLYELW